MDLGLAKNPDQWIFPFEAGHYAQMAKDYEPPGSTTKRP